MGISKDTNGKIRFTLAPSELAAMVAVIGVVASWVLLPHRVAQAEKINDLQGQSIARLESMINSDRIDMADIKATLRSIDARTKRIEEKIP